MIPAKVLLKALKDERLASPEQTERDTEQCEEHVQHYRSGRPSLFTMQLKSLVLLATGLCLCLSVAQGFEDCCLMYVRELTRRTQRHAVSYRFQVTDGDCNLSAVIFTMRRGRELCADPKAKWVTDLIARIDIKKEGQRNPGKRHTFHRKG